MLMNPASGHDPSARRWVGLRVFVTALLLAQGVRACGAINALGVGRGS